MLNAGVQKIVVRLAELPSFQNTYARILTLHGYKQTYIVSDLSTSAFRGLNYFDNYKFRWYYLKRIYCFFVSLTKWLYSF